MGLVSIPKHIVFLILRTEASYWVVLGDRDIGQWWTTQEVNLLGTLNFVGYVLARDTLCGSDAIDQPVAQASQQDERIRDRDELVQRSNAPPRGFGLRFVRACMRVVETGARSDL